jgi:FkbM family methyltransferase
LSKTLQLRANIAYHVQKTIQAASTSARSATTRYPRLKAVLRRIYRAIPSRYKHVTVSLFLEAYAQRKDNVFFVQIGANDGLTGDNLHHLVRRYGWSGILVEPLSDAFSRLKSNYDGQKGLYFENAAIAHSSGEQDLYYLPGVGLEPEIDKDNLFWYDQLGSFSLDHVKKHARRDEDCASIVSERVRTITFAELADKHHLTRIDLLAIDAEGYDYEILKQIDFERFRPEVILFEHRHLPEGDRIACTHFLEEHGYKLRHFALDTLALSSKPQSETH